MSSNGHTLPAIMPDGTTAPTVLTEPEAMLFLRIDDDPRAAATLRNYRASGALQCSNVGRKRLYRSADLLAFLDHQSGLKRRGGK